MNLTSDILQKLGLRIGHYTDKENLTGTTVFIGENPMRIGIDQRGSNPATFNVGAIQPKMVGDQVNAVVFTGGSTFGLEACSGVMNELEREGIGFQTRVANIPGVIGAVIFDLGVGSPDVRPGLDEGRSAVKSASFENLSQGNIGVGTGATTGKWLRGGKLKGGFGMAYEKLLDNLIVSAFVVTNAVGDIVNPESGNFFAEEGGYSSTGAYDELKGKKLFGLVDGTPTNTTLVVIATNADLNRDQLMKVSEIANDGMARAIYPVHTMMDGDIIFSVSTAEKELLDIDLPSPTLIDIIGTTAADVLQEAIKNSIISADAIEGFGTTEG